MKYRILFLLAAMSLPICVATVVVGIRSYQTGSVFGYMGVTTTDTLRRDYYVVSDQGRLQYIWFHQQANRIGPRWMLSDVSPVYSNDVDKFYFGFGFNVYGSPFPFGWHNIAVPHWFLAAIFAMASAGSFRAARRIQRRKMAGLCMNCGYDLRATPNLCPECGSKSV